MENAPDPPPPSLPPSRGPLYTAVAAMIVTTGLLIAMFGGMPLTLETMLAIVAPGTMVSATCVAVAMGWIFVLAGRQHREASSLRWTMVAIALATIELLVLILFSLQVPNLTV